MSEGRTGPSYREASLLKIHVNRWKNDLLKCDLIFTILPKINL